MFVGNMQGQIFRLVKLLVALFTIMFTKVQLQISMLEFRVPYQIVEGAQLIMADLALKFVGMVGFYVSVEVISSS